MYFQPMVASRPSSGAGGCSTHVIRCLKPGHTKTLICSTSMSLNSLAISGDQFGGNSSHAPYIFLGLNCSHPEDHQEGVANDTLGKARDAKKEAAAAKNRRLVIIMTHTPTQDEARARPCGSGSGSPARSRAGSLAPSARRTTDPTIVPLPAWPFLWHPSVQGPGP